MLQDHLNIVETFGRRSAENHIIRPGNVLFDLLIAEHLTVELFRVALQTCLIDIKRGKHLSAKLDDRTSVGLGDIACADH